MKKDIIISGFGGQGSLTAGKFVAKAGMKEGKCVSWLPSYGPEMRGGTAYVMVVVDDKPVASPLVTKCDILVALNQPSVDRFVDEVRPGGTIIINTDMCPNPVSRTDVTVVNLPMNKIAEEAGSPKVLSLVPVGAIIAATGLVTFETVEADLTKDMGAKNPALLEANIKAIKAGMAGSKK